MSSANVGGMRAAFAVLVLAVMSLLAGCGGADEGQVLRRWTLHTRASSHPVELPIHLNGELPNRVDRYTLSTEVLLDATLRNRDLDLSIPYLPAQVALRVDGAVVRPSLSAGDETRERRIGPHRWEIPASAIREGRLSLTLDVTHSWTQSAWLDVPPRLVPSGTDPGTVRRNIVLNDRGGWFGMVGLSQMGLTFLAVYFWDRRRRAYLWFAIQALTASYYPAYVLGLTRGLGTAFEALFLAQSLAIATIISVYYTHDFFGVGRPHRAWLGLLAIGMLVPISATFTTFVDASYATPGVLVCVAATIVYQIGTGTRLVSSYADRRIGVFFLCCWLALGGSAWVDLWAWFGGGEVLAGGRPACIGLGLFGIFQSMLLSRSHFRSLQEADQLNLTLRGRLRDLEERQTEIVNLNEELRQQVGRRSAHILAALAGNEDDVGSSALEPGDVVEERYRVIGALGSGGMGTVYEVERLHDRRRLALKVTLERQGLALARLAREAQIATRVQHANVVAVVDADVAKAGYVYLVMELVEGSALGEYEGRKDVVWCEKVLLQVIEGVRALHAQGIIHRDLKPANVLLSGDIEHDPKVKITDFGISRGFAEPDDAPPAEPHPASKGPEPATVRISVKPSPPSEGIDSDLTVEHAHGSNPSASNSPQLTRTGAISGTPSYIAPELARRGAEITPALDVFSFGVVAHRLLTGLPPHTEAPFLACVDGRKPSPHVPLAIPHLPQRLARLLDACLAFSPGERPETFEIYRALVDALERTASDARAPVWSGPT